MNKLKEIKNQMQDELFKGQAWYAAVSKEDIIWLVNRIESLENTLLFIRGEYDNGAVGSAAKRALESGIEPLEKK